MRPSVQLAIGGGALAWSPVAELEPPESESDHRRHVSGRVFDVDRLRQTLGRGREEECQPTTTTAQPAETVASHNPPRLRGSIRPSEHGPQDPRVELLLTEAR
jgi:hypothetical protein